MCEMRWSRSTCSAETPNCVATASRSSRSMVNPGPVLGPAQRSQSSLLGRETLEALLIAARVKRGDGVRDVGLVVAESWAVGQVEDRLLRRGHQHRPEFGAGAFGIEAVGVALDEPHDGGSIGQRDGMVSAWHGHDCDCDGARHDSVKACCTESHDDDVLLAVDRSSDPSGNSFQFWNPPAPQHVLRNYHVVSVGQSVEEAMIGQSDQLGSGVGVHSAGVARPDCPQWGLGQGGWNRCTAVLCHVRPSSTRFVLL